MMISGGLMDLLHMIISYHIVCISNDNSISGYFVSA